MKKAAAVARKEFRQIARDKRTLMILLFVPVFFLLLYGYALNWDIRHVRLAVEDRDRTPESRSIVSAFVNSGYFDLVASVDAAHITPLMDKNEVRAVIVIPHPRRIPIWPWHELGRHLPCRAPASFSWSLCDRGHRQAQPADL